MKRMIALLLALVMVLGLFAGCAKEEAPAAPAPDASADAPADAPADTSKPADSSEPAADDAVEEGATITMAMVSTYEHTSDTWIFQKIKEYTGVTVVPMTYPNEVYKEKLSTFLAGDLPDIMWVNNFMTLAEINTYGDQGAFINLNDHMDAIPSFKAIFVDNAVNADRYSYFASTATGANYTMPAYLVNRDVNHGMMYRADILEELGLEIWTDTESFYEVLKAIKEAYPESYPLTGKEWLSTSWRLLAGFGVNTTDNAFDYETGKWYLGSTDERVYEYGLFLKKLYEEGLMDPDFFTNDVETMQAKLINGESMVFNDWIGRMGILNPQGQAIDADFDLVYGPNIGDGKILAQVPFVSDGCVIANNDNAAASLKVMEFLYSDEGRAIMTIGVEGENFEWDENGNPVYPELEGQTVDTVVLEETYGIWQNNMSVYPDRRSVYYNFTDHEQAAQDLMNANNSYIQPIPPAIVPAEDATTYADLFATHQAAFMEFFVLFVTDPSYGEAEWNAWVETANANYGEMIDILNGN